MLNRSRRNENVTLAIRCALILAEAYRQEGVAIHLRKARKHAAKALCWRGREARKALKRAGEHVISARAVATQRALLEPCLAVYALIQAARS